MRPIASLGGTARVVCFASLLVVVEVVEVAAVVEDAAVEATVAFIVVTNDGAVKAVEGTVASISAVDSLDMCNGSRPTGRVGNLARRSPLTLSSF